jgi:predicted aspartyl protease
MKVEVLFAAAALGLLESETAAARPDFDGLGPPKIELASPEVVVQMAEPGRQPVVEAKINGSGPFRFFLDTGAHDPVLNPDLVDELKLPVTGSRRIGDPAEPESISARTLRVDRLTIGGAAFSGVTAVTWEGAGNFTPEGVRGVLGLSLFVDLLLTIDYPKRELRIARGELSASEPGVVAYKAGPHGMVRVPVTVGSVSIDADLDTGSPASVSLPKKYADRLPLESTPVQVGRARTVGGEFAIYAANAKGQVRIGKEVLETSSLEFHERLPVANVGYRALRDFAITIDQRNRRLRFVGCSGSPAT